MVTKSIVCLANSFRPGGSCVAGIEVSNVGFGPWIRPISHRPDQAISDDEKTYADGTRLSMLDMVEIDFDAHRPEHHQTENWLVKNGARWRKVGIALPHQLGGALFPPNRPLWLPAQSTYTGRNDQVTGQVAHASNWSLALLNPATCVVDVSFNKFSESNEVWVSFAWASVRHKIKLTDPVQFARFNTGVGHSYTLENALLCLSLAHVWVQKNTASKLVAGLVV